MNTSDSTIRVTQTRTTADGFKRRRYVQGAKRWSTIEVPVERWKELADTRTIRQKNRAALRERALELHDVAGLTAKGVAVKLGVHVRTVQGWLKR